MTQVFVHEPPGIPCSELKVDEGTVPSAGQGQAGQHGGKKEAAATTAAAPPLAPADFAKHPMK